MKSKANHVVSLGAVILLAAFQLLAQSADNVHEKAVALTQQMTLEEKIDYIGGTGFAIRAVPRLKLPAFEMSDGPIGVRANTAFPPPCMPLALAWRLRGIPHWPNALAPASARTLAPAAFTSCSVRA